MKKIIFILMILFLFINNACAIEINSNNVVMYNLNDKVVIYEKNSNEKVSIASLTNIMTT